MPANIEAAARHCERMFDALGISGDEQTPTRYVRALAELTGGTDPKIHLDVQFDVGMETPQLVTVRGVGFASMCEHHMLPFWGTALMAYLPKPGGKVVGLSKLPRALGELARRPQTQERLTDQMAEAMMAHLDADGAGVAIQAAHTCMALRGVRAGTSAEMLTVALRGALTSGQNYDRFYSHLALPAR